MTAAGHAQIPACCLSVGHAGRPVWLNGPVRKRSEFFAVFSFATGYVPGPHQFGWGRSLTIYGYGQGITGKILLVCYNVDVSIFFSNRSTMTISRSMSLTDMDHDAIERKGIALIAKYRSRVYEAYFLSEGHQAKTTQELIRSGTAKPTILVIEDNADEWFMIRWTLLRQFPEVDLVWLSEAVQVMPYMDSFRQTPKEMPALILIDLYLPEAEAGFTVLKNLKAHSLYHRIPVVTLSRSDDPGDIAEALHCSSNLYVVKPAKYDDWLEEFKMLRTYWKEESAL